MLEISQYGHWKTNLKEYKTIDPLSVRRLRGLLQQLQRGEISADVLQKNLLYAAKVLEAVFIDETK